MSTTPPPVAPSSTAPSTSSYSPLSNTSTLLFGFLISALSIFAVFMTSAIIWNRLVARRRAIDAMLEMSPPPGPQRLHRPTIWDVWAVPDKQPLPWLDIKPVAAQQYDYPTSSPQTTQTERTMSFWRHHLSNRLPPEIAYLFHRPIPQAPSVMRDTDISQVELSHGSDIQISLLISMPYAPQSTQEGNHEDRQRLHEMVFATANVLYHDPAPS
ncbi:hypothetical protein J3R83DRAFT_4948 [Lanmaoa asiatica]|nr:hypothetical protein J3R83DRAFT_4948 [Lanmaoa asiatica]